MTLEPLPTPLLARIGATDVRAYARGTGWRRVSGVNGTLAIYQRPGSDLDQLLIPVDPGLSDYARLMGEVVRNLAESEGRPAGEVLNDLLMPPSDVLRFRVDEPLTGSGLVPLSRGIELLQGAQKALLSAACSVDHPQPFHPRLSRAEAEQFLEACRLGQTERGSFTAVVSCPLDAVGPEPTPPPGARGDEEGETAGPPPAEPFARKATSLLMRTVSGLARAVDEDAEADLEETPARLPGLSANLCESLLMMQPSGDRSRLSLHATWSRTLPPPPEDPPPSVVHLRREHFPLVERLAVALRPAHPPRTAQFLAMVDALLGNPDADQRVSGEVQLLVFNADEPPFRARVHLDPDAYREAWQAHGGAQYVSLSGVLRRGGRLQRIEGVEHFRRIHE